MRTNSPDLTRVERPYYDTAESIVSAVTRHRMYGLDEVVRLCLTALYTDGHVLLEGNPGLGKTALVRTLGEQILHLRFGRIQFTPDLMPADITGTYRPNFEDGNEKQFIFKPGPIFCNLLLADEINRATPKTQSAMLEAMAERQVTVLGVTRKMTDTTILDIPIFMVLATQNPIDQQGTFDLPEAQSDRFMFKILLQMPGNDVLSQIIEKEAGVEPLSDGDLSALTGLPKTAEQSYIIYQGIKQAYRRLELPQDSVEKHILNMIQASNRHYAQVKNVRPENLERLSKICALMRYGLGTRAAFMLARGAKAYTLLFIRDAVSAASGAALARVALPILRHRILLEPDWQDSYRALGDKGLPARFLRDEPVTQDRLLMDFFLSTAPQAVGYRETLADVAADVLKSGI